MAVANVLFVYQALLQPFAQSHPFRSCIRHGVVTAARYFLIVPFNSRHQTNRQRVGNLRNFKWLEQLTEKSDQLIIYRGASQQMFC